MSKTKKQKVAHLKWPQGKVIRISIFSLVFICVYAISMYVPLIGGFTAYPIATIKCGRSPIITSNFMGVYDYTEPGMQNYYGATALNTMSNYVCTVHDAESQGYHKAAS